MNYSHPIELNRYGYAAGNPVNLSDPSGLASMTETSILDAFSFRKNEEFRKYYVPLTIGLAVIVAYGLLMSADAGVFPVPQGMPRLPKLDPRIIRDAIITAATLYLLLIGLQDLDLEDIDVDIRIDEGSADIVYRNPNPSQHPLARLLGFFPKDPSANFSVEYHVRYGSKPNVKTQYISMTRSLNVALAKQVSGIPIYIIDLEKVLGTVYDLTNESILLANISNPIAQNYARASREVVLDGWIPPFAILGTIP